MRRSSHAATAKSTIAKIACGLVQQGVRQLVVAGGETSGACVQALGIEPGAAQSYGKAAIVGEAGELEHAAAILHPKLGAPLRKGDLLLKLAHTEDNYLELEIDQVDVHEVRVGSRGEFALVGRPDQRFAIELTQHCLVPISIGWRAWSLQFFMNANSLYAMPIAEFPAQIFARNKLT